MRNPTSVKVYWDVQDPDNESWAYVASDEQGLIDSGSLDADPNDLYGAIEEAISATGIKAIIEDFGYDHNTDGGYADWDAA